jgi:hypothetical protein
MFIGTEFDYSKPLMTQRILIVIMGKDRVKFRVASSRLQKADLHLASRREQ